MPSYYWVAWAVFICGVWSTHSLRGARAFPMQDQVGWQQEQLFDPARQSAITTSKGDIRVDLLKSERCAECSSAYQLTLSVTSATNAFQPRQFIVRDGPAQLDSLHVLDSERVALLGWAQSSVGMVAILDMVGAKILDKWLCFRPTMSPNERWIAFQKMYPLHFTESVSSEYLVYDTTRAPAENRRATVSRDDITNVGLRLYPIGDLNVVENKNLRHQPGSRGFFWSPDSTKVAFADRSGGVNALVLADLKNGADKQNVVASSLDHMQIVDRNSCQEYAGREEYAFSVSRVEFLEGSGTRMRVYFSFPVPECAKVHMLEFVLPQAAADRLDGPSNAPAIVTGRR